METSEQDYPLLMRQLPEAMENMGTTVQLDHQPYSEDLKDFAKSEEVASAYCRTR